MNLRVSPVHGSRLLRRNLSMLGLNVSFWLVTTRVLLLRSRYFQDVWIDPQSGQRRRN